MVFANSDKNDACQKNSNSNVAANDIAGFLFLLNCRSDYV